MKNIFKFILIIGIIISFTYSILSQTNCYTIDRSRLEWTKDSTQVGVKENINENFLLKCHPNPFSSLSEIQYFVSKKEHATLVLTDLGGRVVANLVDRYVNGGWNTLIVNGSGLTAGVYILRLESLGKAAMMKIVKAD